MRKNRNEMKGYSLHNQTDHPVLIMAENTRLHKDLKVIRKKLQLSDKSCHKSPKTAKTSSLNRVKEIH